MGGHPLPPLVPLGPPAEEVPEVRDWVVWSEQSEEGLGISQFFTLVAASQACSMNGGPPLVVPLAAGGGGGEEGGEHGSTQQGYQPQQVCHDVVDLECGCKILRKEMMECPAGQGRPALGLERATRWGREGNLLGCTSSQLPGGWEKGELCLICAGQEVHCSVLSVALQAAGPAVGWLWLQ